ncbi:MAG: DUF2934 domain-containing protein [Gammaproteobacteria bacterium]|nr:MAG: DUF2934 domain-containing protein [Gammaproteobacteria bacterium]
MAKTVSKSGTPAGAGTVVSPEERWRMIAEAAYFRALQRGFSGGDSVEDWLVAEREVDERLMRMRPSMKQPAASAMPGRSSVPGAASRHTIPSH